MSQLELTRREEEVEAARRRVSDDVQRLRAPMAHFKQDLWAGARESRDDLVVKIEDAARDRAQRILADMKDRAAANPVAVLAIGAGLAWRLLRKPPIATLLTGFGIVSLMRTDPRNPGPAATAVTDFAVAAKEEAVRLGQEAGELLAVAKEKTVEWTAAAGEAAGVAHEKARQWQAQATEALADAGDAAAGVQEKVKELGTSAAETIVDVANKAQSLGGQASDAVYRMTQDVEGRDKLLLGAAAAAIVAAVGIASHRRLNEDMPA